MSRTNDAPSLDINAGLNYERARDRLNQDAGQAFRRYMLLKNNPSTSADAMTAARKAYAEASDECRRLRPDDAAGIAAIVGGLA